MAHAPSPRSGVASRLPAAGRIGLALAVAAATATVTAPRVDAQQATWRVQVGAYGDAPNHSIDLMLPSVLTVRVGDTVEFVRPSPGTPHTVTFLSGAPAPETFVPVPGGPPGAMQANPATMAPSGGPTYDGTGIRNSGAMGLVPNLPDTYRLTFTAAGSFGYQCLLHPYQQGTIVVVPAGAALPMANQAAVDAAAQAEIARAKNELSTLARQQAQAYPRRAGQQVTVGMDVPSRLGAVAQYFPATLQVRAGETVVWRNDSPYEIHTVTFLGGAPMPPLILPNGWVNPEAGAPAGGPVFTGRANSGIMGGGAVYQITFNQPGTYPYICLVHEELHTGVIEVVAGAPGAGPGAGPGMGPGVGPGLGPGMPGGPMMPPAAPGQPGGPMMPPGQPGMPPGQPGGPMMPPVPPQVPGRPDVPPAVSPALQSIADFLRGLLGR